MFSWLTGAKDLLDILLVATLIYQGYLLLENTRALNVLRGILIFVVVWLLASYFKLATVDYLLSKAATVGLFAMVVVFQPELRQLFERLGRPRGREDQQAGAVVNEIARAVEHMAERSIGALIALERRTPLGEYAASGVKLDAMISAPFLEAIFARNAPLHDGGVIVKDGRVVAAGCVFPLQNQQDGVYKRYGTRHRSALGLSEGTDAVVIVVSEERGSIRLAQNGRLSQDLNANELRDKLRALLYEVKS
ncbi:diadenylate cyclase CdaA [Deinococcus roseus]|uniref:Diadenylate cyclase n=1 Tax=Deinococcus roseus TaxID=392414 RepID=A0ABQ2D094_9DEIO|nr:diadenylate cyclase CdaA [Deinococcus roseus]GGJ33576.1 TIGR00159 family protein [Deinococcus roseus]